MNKKVTAICISPKAGEPMRLVPEVRALEGQGLEGDRYATGEGSFNEDKVGKRQVTFINKRFFEGSGFKYEETRRNIVTEGVELNDLFGKEFQVGEARFRGVKYCDPCKRPSNLSKNSQAFNEVFSDCGGLIAEVIEGGTIKVGDAIVTPKKDY